MLSRFVWPRWTAQQSMGRKVVKKTATKGFFVVIILPPKPYGGETYRTIWYDRYIHTIVGVLQEPAS